MTVQGMLEEVVGFIPHYIQIDHEVATKEVCNCGNNFTYRGYRYKEKSGGSIYLAFMVCETCNIAKEF